MTSREENLDKSLGPLTAPIIPNEKLLCYQDAKVEATASLEGWLFRYGDRIAGPYRSLNDVNNLEVAHQLGCEPRLVLEAKLSLSTCILRERPRAAREGDDAICVKVSELDASLVNKRVTLNVQIVVEQSQKALPRSIRVRCRRCFRESIIPVERENLDFLQAVIFNQKKELLQLAQKRLLEEMGRCNDGRYDHSPSIDYEGYVDYAVLGVRDLLEETERFSQEVLRVRKVHLIREKPPTTKKVRIHGVVIVHPYTRELCIMADGIQPLESQVVGFAVTDEDRTEWLKYFGPEKNLTAQIAPDMVGREIVQRAYLLLLHSPPTIPDVEGKTIRGSLRIVCFGDTKTNKTESVKDFTIGHYHLGGYIVAESSSRTGITYTIDTENRMIVWGELPNNDLGLVVIDGLHAMFAEELRELRECLESQRVIVRRSVSGEALARTRTIGILNPRKPMSHYVYPCQAIVDNPAFHEAPDVTRWDLFLPFARDDVPEEEVIARKTKARPVPDDVFKRHVFWAWSRKPEHIQYTDDARRLIIDTSIQLIKEYASDSISVVHLGVRDVVCRLSAAQACLDHSTDETHTLIIVEKGHVEKAIAFYRAILDRLQLAQYKQEEEGSLQIMPSEMEELIKELDEVELRILNAIKLGSKSSSVLAEELDLSEKTVKRHYKALQKHGLVTTRTGVGITLTARGVKFLKILGQSNRDRKCPYVPKGSGRGIMLRHL